MKNDTREASLSPLATLMELSWKAASSYIAAHPNRQVAPPISAETADGQRIIMMTPWRNEDDKRVMLEMLRHKFRELGVRRYVLSVEAYMAEYSEGPKDPNDPAFVMPNKRTDRVEILMIVGVDPAAGESLQYNTKILRRNGRRTLAEREVLPHSAAMEGRMTTLLGPVTPRTVN